MCDDAHILERLDDIGGSGITAPRKNIDRDTLSAKLATEFADIHVHAPGVFRPECRDRGGVNTDHRDTSYVAKVTGPSAIVETH